MPWVPNWFPFFSRGCPWGFTWDLKRGRRLFPLARMGSRCSCAIVYAIHPLRPWIIRHIVLNDVESRVVVRYIDLTIHGAPHGKVPSGKFRGKSRGIPRERLKVQYPQNVPVRESHGIPWVPTGHEGNFPGSRGNTLNNANHCIHAECVFYTCYGVPIQCRQQACSTGCRIIYRYHLLGIMLLV